MKASLAAGVIALVSSGFAAGVSVECDAIDRLTHIDEAIHTDIVQSLRDADIDVLEGLVDEYVADLRGIRDNLEDAEGQTVRILTAAASGFITGLNFLAEGLTRDPPQDRTVDRAGELLADAREDLGVASSLASERCAGPEG